MTVAQNIRHDYSSKCVTIIAQNMPQLYLKRVIIQILLVWMLKYKKVN